LFTSSLSLLRDERKQTPDFGGSSTADEATGEIIELIRSKIR